LKEISRSLPGISLETSKSKYKPRRPICNMQKITIIPLYLFSKTKIRNMKRKMLFILLLICSIIGMLPSKAANDTAGINTTANLATGTDTLKTRNHTQWILGIFYYNPDDKRIFPPKSSGMGWTVNFANPVSIAFAILIIAAIILIFSPLKKMKKTSVS